MWVQTPGLARLPRQNRRGRLPPKVTEEFETTPTADAALRRGPGQPHTCLVLSPHSVGVNSMETKETGMSIHIGVPAGGEARGNRSRGVGGAPLQQEGVAGVADSDRFGRGGQRQLVIGAAVAENLTAVATVVLEKERRVSHGCWGGGGGDPPFSWRWRTPSHTACSDWRPCPSAKPDPPETVGQHWRHPQA